MELAELLKWGFAGLSFFGIVWFIVWMWSDENGVFTIYHHRRIEAMTPEDSFLSKFGVYAILMIIAATLIAVFFFILQGGGKS